MDNKRTSRELLLPLVSHDQHWEALSRYLRDEEQRLLSQLRTCDTEHLKDLQGQLKPLATLLELREALIRERQSK